MRVPNENKLENILHDEQEKFMLHKFELIRHMFDEDY